MANRAEKAIADFGRRIADAFGPPSDTRIRLEIVKTMIDRHGGESLATSPRRFDLVDELERLVKNQPGVNPAGAGDTAKEGPG